MRERLVCYLLGELDQSEREELEAQLAQDPALRQELEHLRSCLLPGTADDDEEAGPPPDLARRTAMGVCSSGAEPASAVDMVPSCSSLTFVDSTVAVGVVLAVSMLLLPALRESRDVSRRNTCANNLREIGTALELYSEEHGYYPAVGREENAGLFSVRLADSGLLTREQIRELIVCPGSTLADQVARQTVYIHLPRLEELAQTPRLRVHEVRCYMGGSLAYRVGYLAQGEYVPKIRNQRDSHAPVLSDAPHPLYVGSPSPNHGGLGGNVLFQDGRVDYVVGSRNPVNDDHFFVNRQHRVGPGLSSNDAVLMRSEVSPHGMPGVHLYMKPDDR